MATVQDYLNNAEWVKKVEQAFATMDKNKNGYIEQSDIESFYQTVDELAAKCPDRPDKIAKCREVSLEFFTDFGMAGGVKADLQMYKELGAKYAIRETARVQRGEMTLIEKMYNAYFDVYDLNQDGFISWDEYQYIFAGGTLEPEAIKAAFDFMDKNNDGRVNRKEFAAADVKFWTTLDDPSTKGMYGDKY